MKRLLSLAFLVSVIAPIVAGETPQELTMYERIKLGAQGAALGIGCVGGVGLLLLHAQGEMDECVRVERLLKEMSETYPDGEFSDGFMQKVRNKKWRLVRGVLLGPLLPLVFLWGTLRYKIPQTAYQKLCQACS